jgi:hypothetical protein
VESVCRWQSDVETGEEEEEEEEEESLFKTDAVNEEEGCGKRERGCRVVRAEADGGGRCVRRSRAGEAG